MNEYRPKASRIVRGIILLLIGLAAMWFTADVFWVYTPLYDAPEGEYVRGEITEIKKRLPAIPYRACMSSIRRGLLRKRWRGFIPRRIFTGTGLRSETKYRFPEARLIPTI